MSQTGIQPNSNLCAVQRELLWSSERCQDIVDRVCAERPTPARVTTSAPMPGFPGGYSHHGTNPRERRCVEYEVTSQLQTELFPGMLERLAQLNASLYHFSLESWSIHPTTRGTSQLTWTSVGPCRPENLASWSCCRNLMSTAVENSRCFPATSSKSTKE